MNPEPNDKKNMNIRHTILPAALFGAFIPASAAVPPGEWHGASPDWTETAEADRKFIGDYEGRWTDATGNHYHSINPEFVGQVMNVGEGHYRIHFKQEFDRRANRYIETDAHLDGDVLRFDAHGWAGEISADGKLSGTLRQGDHTLRYELTKVERTSPTLGMEPPPGAIVLFDGSNFDAWQHGDGRDVTWHLVPEEQAMEVRFPRNQEERGQRIGGDIQTRQMFTDCRLHVEYRYPVEPGKAGQGRGNSGVFLQNTYEVQVLNSYGLTGFWNENAALYKHTPPAVNASLPPGRWQTYDITYRAPGFENGKKVSNGRITVRHNGVVVHNDVELLHATAWAFDSRRDEGQAANPAPIRLQDHGNAIQFRNIWVLEGVGD